MKKGDDRLHFYPMAPQNGCLANFDALVKSQISDGFVKKPGPRHANAGE